MARDFDGTNDNLLTANNALPGMNVAAKTCAFWHLRAGDPGANQAILAGATADGAGNFVWSVEQIVPTVSGFRWVFNANWTTDGLWRSADQVSTTRWHVAFTYDRGATTNNPVCYVNGVSTTMTAGTAPVGTAVTGDDTLKAGETVAGGSDFTGKLGNITVDLQLWTAAQANRAMWWGRPHGGLLVYHPLYTTKLADEGSGAETIVATGTTVQQIVAPVVRPGTAMLGCGVGW